MKEIISLLFLLVFLVTVVGCSAKNSNQQNEGDNKAEIGAKADNEINENNGTQSDDYVENTSDRIILKGKLISDSGIGYGVLLDDNVNVQGETVNQIYEKDFLKDEYNGSSIDIEAYVDKNSFEYCDEIDAVSVDAEELISLNGEKNPTYKADQDYPLDFYTSTYNEDFKIAVDKILESGLSIQLAEGKYIGRHRDGSFRVQSEVLRKIRLSHLVS